MLRSNPSAVQEPKLEASGWKRPLTSLPKTSNFGPNAINLMLEACKKSTSFIR